MASQLNFSFKTRWELPPLSSPPFPILSPKIDAAAGWSKPCENNFYLLFQPGHMSALVSAVFLILATAKIYFLRDALVKTVPNRIRHVKLILATALALLQLAVLILWTLTLATPHRTILVTALNLVAALEVIVLSQLEHSRSVQPSPILNVYLLFFPLEFIQSQDYYFHGHKFLALLSLAVAGVKLPLLAVEAQGKRPYLKAEYQNLPPASISGIISRSFLWWLNGLFVQGSKKVLGLRNLFPLDEDLTAEHLGQLLQTEWGLRAKPENPFSFVFSLCRSLGPAYSSVFFPRICLIMFTFAQPFLITQVLEFLQVTDIEGSQSKAYYLAVATGIIYLGIAISSLHSSQNLFRFIVQFRGATVCLIYNRALSIQDSNEALAAVTLMNTDVDRISFCLEELNECWSRLIEIGIGIPLLTRQLGWTSVTPLIVCVLSFAGSSVITRIIASRQKNWADATQRRIAITGATLSQMKSVKMMGLDGVMGRILKEERLKETKLMERYAWVMVWMNVIANVPNVLCPALTFAVYATKAAWTGSDFLDTTTAFTSLALILLVSHPCSRLLCAVPNAAASIGCFDRIQKFLLAKSMTDERVFCQNAESNRVAREHRQVQNGGSVDEINGQRQAKSESLVIRLESAVVRPSPEAPPILKDVNLDIKMGSLICITGPVGSGKTTFLKAILGELHCDKGRILLWTRSIAYCSQKPWIPNGTIRQAICGSRNDEYLDDAWYRRVVEACALDYDISNFPNGDETPTGNSGIALSGGQKQRVALARALYFRPKLFILDDVLSGLDKKTERFVVENVFGSGGLLREIRSTVVFATHAMGYMSCTDKVIILSDGGGDIFQATFDEIKEAGLAIAAEIQNETDEIEGVKTRSDVNFESRLETVAADNEANDLTRQTGDLEVYKYYLKSIGPWRISIFVFFCALNVFSGSFSHIWLKWWTETGGREIGLYICIYFLLAGGYILGIGGYAWAIAVGIGPSTGRNLHQVLLKTVLRAPQCLFTETEIGTILNRFSQDMALIEGQLSFGLLATVSNLFAAIAEAALVAAGSTYMVITIPFLFVAVYYIQRIYLRTSRQLKFLDLESRSPLLAHFLETLEGVSTIRAFGWQQEWRDEHNRRLDASQKPYYLLFCIQRWLALALDLMVAGMAVVVVALATTLRGSTSPGFLGVSLNNILSFNMSVTSFVTGWTVLETSLGAIARVRDFEAETTVEAKETEDTEPPKDWPSKGLIEMENVTAAYNSSAVALQSINIKVLPGQKVSICGRTGSGKSSLFSALLRMLDLTSGIIKVDQEDLSRLPRTTIRERLSVIPQDTLHLVGTVRLNVDPFSRATDVEIIAALEKVQIWPVISLRGGLDAEIRLESLSKGQQQLLALARALLRHSMVVLMDEATSSVDKETECIVRRVLKEEFDGRTVVIIAHRLETILDSDLVAVMSNGQMVEFGPPGKLTEDKESALSRLCRGALGEVVE